MYEAYAPELHEKPMGMTHSHHDHGRANWRALAMVLALTGTYMVVEIAGGLYPHHEAGVRWRCFL